MSPDIKRDVRFEIAFHGVSERILHEFIRAVMEAAKRFEPAGCTVTELPARPTEEGETCQQEK